MFFTTWHCINRSFFIYQELYMFSKYFEILEKNLNELKKKFQSIKFGKIKLSSFSQIKSEKINYAVFAFIFIILASIVFSYNNSIKKKRLEKIDSFISNNQTILLKNYLLNQLRSPYLEYDYIVMNNDTVETILKKFGIKESEINTIVEKIKKMKLSNIIPNQKMKFVLKKTKDNKNMEIISMNYPISKTTFVSIDKSKNKLEVSKNVTELFKRDVVVTGNISNNLYSSAIKVGMEPNK